MIPQHGLASQDIGPGGAARSIAAAIDRNFFFFALALVVPAAARWPGLACTGGPLHPEVTVFWCVIVLIFLLEGLELPTDAMLGAMRRLETHAAVQLFSLVFFPAATLAVCAVLEAAGAPLPPVLREGFIALACVPTTTSMCVMLSAKAGGNQALAAVSALIANTVAIVATPWLLSSLTRIDPNLSYPALWLSLCGKMVLPLLAGQLLRPRLAPLLAPHRPTVIKLSQTLILTLLFQIFSDVFHHGGAVPPATLLRVALLVPILHAVFLAAAWAAGGGLREGGGVGGGCGALSLSRPDRVAFLYCASQKTVVLGVPLLRAVYGDRPPAELVVLLLPLLFYHVLELVVGLCLAPPLRR
ncbi:putative sodium bile acid cotransporter [Baffinella frigidus]|nr:putative sodium bile acid cotransporter [Cryptophyta sp. CCMP2293]